MADYRIDKINEQILTELSQILRVVKDPRVSKSFISIAGVNASKDLSVAKIYYSVYGEDNGAEQGLAAANGFIRKELAARINLRVTPKLVFIRDNSTERAMEISKTLKEVLKDE